MYINFKLAEERGITPSQVLLLQAIKQNKSEDMSELIERICGLDLPLFKDFGLVTFIKAKTKKDTEYKLIRLSDKGSKLLEDILTPEVTSGDIDMWNYLVKMYMAADEDGSRSIGNEKNGKMYCAQFRQIVGLTLHEMYWLCDLFIANHKYTKVLENIFFVKRENLYGKFKDNIESSKLYQFYTSNKGLVEEYWKSKIKE